jgi:hypothetical protein
MINQLVLDGLLRVGVVLCKNQECVVDVVCFAINNKRLNRVTLMTPVNFAICVAPNFVNPLWKVSKKRKKKFNVGTLIINQ